MVVKKYDLILGIALLLLLQFSIFEVHFLVFFILTLLYISNISKDLLTIVAGLFFILFVAIFSSFFEEKTAYNFLKDLGYFLKPIFAIISGYLLAKKINSISRFFRVLIYVAFFYSIIHLVKIFTHVNFELSTISDIRKVGGISNLSVVIAIAILVASFKYKFLDVIENKLVKRIILSVLLLSFVFYFSRTMFVALIVLLLAAYGYIKVTKKGLKYGFIVLLGFSLFYVYLFNTDLDRTKPGLESFLYKMKIAPSEIFTPFREFRSDNHAYLWDHWRSYEATMAFDQTKGFFNVLVGNGLGSLVDLRFDVFLGDSRMRFIPVIHNGYMNLYFKTGIIGLLIYLLLLAQIYLYAYDKGDTELNRFSNNLIAGFGIYFVFTSLIINGIYNIEDYFTFILGALLFYRKKKDFKILKIS